MTTLDTRLKLARWFKGQIWSHKEQIKMPFVFRETFDALFDEFNIANHIQLSRMGAALLSEYMSFLHQFVEERDKTINGSKIAIVFIEYIMAKAIESDGYPISFIDFVTVCLRTMSLKENDLRTAKGPSGKYLTASKRFTRKYNIRVKIPFDDTGGFDKKDDVDDADL